MATKASFMNKFFKRTDIKISVLISCALVVIILVSGRFLAGINSKAISDALHEKGRIVSILGAKSIEISLETAVEKNLLTLEDVFDSQYLPVANTEPQLFHTKFDTYVDEACAQFQQAFYRDDRIVYARPMDLNGYIPLKGDGNSSDSKSGGTTEDPLAKQILAGKRISRIVANTVEGFVQDYISEDNDEHIWEFSTPVYVNGERWGSYSVGLRSPSKSGLGIGASITVLVLTVLSILLSCAVVFGVVLSALKPIPGLAKVAERVADGDVDLSVEVEGSNDIATLADAIERLRVSLKLSMDRLARK
jgi:methyl-accepting chemotaxis protein